MQIEWIEDKDSSNEGQRRYVATVLSFVDLEVREERLGSRPDQERWAFSAKTPWSIAVGKLIGGGYTEELENAKALAIAIAKEDTSEWIKKQREILDWAIDRLDGYEAELKQWEEDSHTCSA